MEPFIISNNATYLQDCFNNYELFVSELQKIQEICYLGTVIVILIISDPQPHDSVLPASRKELFEKSLQKIMDHNLFKSFKF